MAKAKERLLLKREYTADEIVTAIGSDMSKRVKGKNADRLDRTGKYRVEVHFVKSMILNRGTVAIAQIYAPKEPDHA
jgi:hypothetical protein